MLTGKIIWFDATSGEGMVQCLETGESLYCHFTSIIGVDKNGYAYPTQEDQQRLRTIAGKTGPLTIYRNLYSAQVESIAV